MPNLFLVVLFRFIQEKQWFSLKIFGNPRRIFFAIYCTFTFIKYLAAYIFFKHKTTIR